MALIATRVPITEPRVWWRPWESHLGVLPGAAVLLQAEVQICAAGVTLVRLLVVYDNRKLISPHCSGLDKPGLLASPEERRKSHRKWLVPDFLLTIMSEPRSQAMFDWKNKGIYLPYHLNTVESPVPVRCMFFWIWPHLPQIPSARFCPFFQSLWSFLPLLRISLLFIICLHLILSGNIWYPAGFWGFFILPVENIILMGGQFALPKIPD